MIFFQLPATLTAPQTQTLSFFAIDERIQILGLILITAGPICFFSLLILRNFLKEKTKKEKMFNRTVLRVSVPKERKSESTQGNAQATRLDQTKEEIAITETFFAAIAGLRAERGFLSWLFGRTDHFAFEIVMQNQLIYFYIDVPKKRKEFIEQQLHAQYPYAEVEEITDYNIFSPHSHIAGAYLTAQNKHVFPFKTYKAMDSDPLLVTLNTLARVQEHNSNASIQFIVRSANKKWRRKGVYIVREIKKGKKFESLAHEGAIGHAWHKTKEISKDILGPAKNDQNNPQKHYNLTALEEEMIKGIEQKLSKGGMDMTVRIVSSSDSKEIAKANLDNLLNVFSQYNLYRYGNSFSASIPSNQKKLIQDFIYRSFNDSKKTVINTEEMSSFWHLPLPSTEAPNIKWLTGRRAPPPTNLPESGLQIGYVEYRGVKKDVYMKEADRRRHLYIIGKSGGGKSVFISKMAVQDIINGKGVCVVDPHGDLVEYILQHVPKERADDVVLFDPSDVERPVGINMLEAKSADQKDFAVQEMIGIFYKLFPPEMIGPMFEHNMRNVMLTLMADLENPGTIIDIPRMFTDDAYVKQFLKKLDDPVVRAFWEKEMAKTSDFHKSEMLGYLISKVGRFVENDMMRNIMGQQKSGFNFREIMDQKKILLVNLAKGKVGEVNAKLLGLLIVAKLQMAAMARADMDESAREDFYLYVDEFQNFVTDSIATILSEARKYKLDLIVAHQYIGQLVEANGRAPIRDAILGNVGTMCVLRIGPDDAEVLQKEFAPTFGVYDLLNTPQYSAYTKLLIDNTASRPFLMGLLPGDQGNRELGEALRQLSRLKYGRDRRLVEEEILERTQLGVSKVNAKNDMIETSL